MDCILLLVDITCYLRQNTKLLTKYRIVSIISANFLVITASILYYDACILYIAKHLSKYFPLN